MKTIILLFTLLVSLPHRLLAQNEDTLKLTCPLNEPLDPPAEKKSYSIGTADLKAVFTSKSDTVIKACASGMITTILHDDDGKWELMFTHADYTFWYSGISKLIVTQGQKIKDGQAIGYTKRGQKITLQMMDSETSVDPKQYLNCEL